MGGFSRRARWLNRLFPPSEAPATQDPSTLSDDVSLVQQYDGGGLGFPASPTNWFLAEVTGPVGIAGSFILLANDDDSLARIFTASVKRIAGGDAAQTWLAIGRVESLGPDPVTASSALGTNGEYKRFGGNTHQSGGDLGGGGDGYGILGPGHNLQVHWLAGTAATQLKANVYGVIAPLGTVFTI